MPDGILEFVIKEMGIGTSASRSRFIWFRCGSLLSASNTVGL
jgi:hypothetical protein